MPITDDQILELRAYADHMADIGLASKCALALSKSKGRGTTIGLVRQHCEIA